MSAVLTRPGVPADCGVVIVTYNSAADVGRLLDALPEAAPGMRLCVVVVDNDSRDGIAEVVAGRAGVEFVPAGANLGYAGGINLARQRLAGTELRALLVLNPDLRLRPGSVRRLFDELRSPGVGATVPMIIDEDGTLFRTLRREPSVPRALAEALLGDHWSARPGRLAEIVREAEPYQRPGPVEWACGAAVMIDAETDATVGAWDDRRFFLYSEETDYFRRIRHTGRTVRYVPDAVVAHRGGGSGGGPQLVALDAVNRVRYYRKYHGRMATGVFWAVVVLHQLMRVRRPGNRRALRAVLSPGWSL